MLAAVRSASVLGVDAYDVTVEVDAALGLPAWTIVGLPASAVRESRERVAAAILNAGLSLPPRRVAVNLAPAGNPMTCETERGVIGRRWRGAERARRIMNAGLSWRKANRTSFLRVPGRAPPFSAPERIGRSAGFRLTFAWHRAGRCRFGSPTTWRCSRRLDVFFV
jgi:hypothetical protein